MSLERLRAGIETWLARKLAPLDLDVLYPSTVVGQNADGTLEILPDSARVGSHSSVPIRYPHPGATIEVDSDARCLLGFAGRSELAPYACGFEPSDKLRTLAIDGDAIELGAAAGAVIRHGDTIEIYIYSPGKVVVATGIVGIVSGTAETPPAVSKVVA